MPLEQGSNNEVVGDNVKEVMATGRPQKQAVAIALRVAGKARPVGVSKPNKEVRVKKG